MRMADLATALRVRKSQVPRLRKLVAALVDEGVVVKPSRMTYAVADEPRPRRKDAAEPLAVGRIRVHPAGYGFVERDDHLDDIFIPAKYRGAALDGDRVSVYTWDGYKGTEGRVEEVLARGRAKLTGVVRRAGRSFVLDPDDPRVASSTDAHVAIEDLGPARPGDCVLAEITEYPRQRRGGMTVRVLRVLGEPGDPRTEVAKIVACADIPDEFPDDAKAQAARTPQALRKLDLADRIDLRDREFLTIDPETARDFDDAICIERNPGGGWRVWVAVADVSHYVRPDDALDREAQIRGVSVYFPDRAIPMLPPELSSGICSLNPGVDRCAMVVRIDYDDDATVRDTGFAAAVIRSRARLDYPGVGAALSGDFRGRIAAYRKWVAALRDMDALAQRLRRRRMARGALELELPEPKVILDEDDPLLVRDVARAKSVPSERRAYELVEEFMLAANEAVGEYFARRKLPTIWRVHAPPAETKLAELAAVLEGFGIYVDEEEAQSPRGLKRVIDAVRGHPAESSLMFLVLRSLTQAVYTTDNIGHFGLASDAYLHFTSPIRRYPDVIVHRLLKYHLHREGQASGGGGAFRPPPVEELEQIAAACSGYERRAMEAEREVVDMYEAYLMRDRVGETFVATIVAVTHFGVFVRLDEPFVEGLIKLENLGDDFFEHDPLHMTLTGRKTGARFRIGDAVRVELIEASVQRRQIDFRLAATTPAGPGGSRTPRRRDDRGRGRRGADSGSRRKRKAAEGRDTGRGGRGRRRSTKGRR